MIIAIRADGGSNIGMGHIMRTLVLAKELSLYNDVFYICRVDNPLSDKYKAGIDKIRSEGFNVVVISENSVVSDMMKIEADLLITDSYEVDENYFNETKKKFNKTAYIDDMNLYYFNVDFLINQNMDGKDFKYKVNENTKLLVGPQYVMLREEFRNVPLKQIKENPNDIMITVGGADPNHITEQLIKFLGKLNYNLHIVIGPSFIKNSSLLNMESKKVIMYQNANMYEIMQKCDVAISACGSTLYELAVCGVPTLGIIIASNQQGLAIKMDEMGLIKNMGWYIKLSEQTFNKALVDLCNDFKARHIMTESAKSAIDGSGVKRIVQELTC